MLASLACALGGGLPLLGGPRRPQKTARARIIPQVRDEVKRRGRKLCPIAARRLQQRRLGPRSRAWPDRVLAHSNGPTEAQASDLPMAAVRDGVVPAGVVPRPAIMNGGHCSHPPVSALSARF